ncbi:MAG: hypothetical protein R3F59_28735 [Myxococcota bacterium]
MERLVMAPDAGWEDAMPAPAGLPGSGALSAGRGAVLGCEARACWPRPPQGATTARVTGRRWSRTVQTRRLVASQGEGWDDAVPRGHGVLPARGEGGSEGLSGSPSCRAREREPERCHDETHREACGTTERCTRRDLGNGFAEEVCRDETKYCTRSERVCTPAVRDDWCTWTVLRWQDGRREVRQGTDEPPAWPALAPRPDEAVSRTATYTLDVAPLAGPGRREVHLDDAEALQAHRPGALVYAWDGRAEAVPPALVPQGTAPRFDCGDAVPADRLAERRWCDFERWAWRAEPPRTARDPDGAPPWPDGALGRDGRETRQEWLLVDLAWTRGEALGTVQQRYEVGAWDDWAPDTTVGVRVDRQARFLGFAE